MLRHGAHACTDVTGFGLMGHLSHMARESAGHGAHRRPRACRCCRARWRCAVRASGRAAWTATAPTSARASPSASHLEDALADLLFDPQTSGGLLIALPGDNAEALVADLAAQGLTAARVGEIAAPSEWLIVVE